MIKLTTTDILNVLKQPEINKIKVAAADIDGILRGKVLNKEKFMAILETGFGFCDVVFGWDSNDTCYEAHADFTGWHSGYPDTNAKVDLQTFRRVPWDNELPFFLADFYGTDDQRLAVCPRNLLKTVRDQAVELGYKAVFAQEFEWFNFLTTSDELHDNNFTDLKPLTSGMFGYSLLRASQNKAFFNDIFDACEQFAIPLEGLHTETGPGVYEAAILYDEILESADRAILFKTAVKEIAHNHGITATFMAKWHNELPGCSGHIHQSLWQGKNNVFHDANDEQGMSTIMKHYVAGILHCLPHLLPLYAPNINSYKRLVEGAWAPTTLTWGLDNRTTAIRVLPGSNQSTRLELRVVGSDVNPYLAMAASLASGLYGIKHQLSLQDVTLGNGYQDNSHGRLPSDLWQATQALKNSTVAKEILGADFVKHFVQTREWEWRQHAKAVTDWELKRYFEVI